VFEQLVWVGVKGDHLIADRGHISAVVVCPAARLGDALVALGELGGELLALLLDLRDGTRDLGLLLLRPGRARLLARLGQLDAERRELFDLELVLRLDASGLLFRPGVDLPADAAGVLGQESRYLRRVAVGAIVDEHPHHVLRAQLVLRGQLAVVPRGVD